MPQILKKCITAYGDFKAVKLAPVKDNCALFYLPPIFGVEQFNGVI